MLSDAEKLLRALRLPAETRVDFEPLSDAAAAPERVALCAPGEAERIVLVRRSSDADAAMNHVAVMEALTNGGYLHAPRLLGVIDDLAIEEWIEGATALALVPPPGACEAAIEALAEFHALPLREGLRWGATPGDIIPDNEVPLHRLGFAAHEREPAGQPLAEATAALLATPFGFVHGDATAAHVLLSRDRATLVNFERAGYGAQLMDVAAFLLTSGLDAPARRVLAGAYARRRGLDVFATIDCIDLAGIVWGIEHQLGLPRRLIESLGDEPASEALHTAAARVERGLRTSAGDHPAAAAIRAALWPE